MKQVTRYECEWCGKLFRTPSRHKCRFDPANRNCLSCRHCGKFGAVEDEGPEVCVGDGAFARPTIVTKGFRCEQPGTDVGDGFYNDFPAAVSCTPHGGHGCPGWEPMPGYTGSRSFAKQQRELAMGKLDEAEGGAE